ncbi:hypothetical protein ASG39_21255 [Rhizobium sp. Leaf371]|uniref:response regulator n=1 Tax=Rhizobium sp. Leaf371 TaxID=1736355 RepID=UPI000715EF9D|nr:response regulator [Rhizobium sp. Leaf371]KQS71777.1 hypothetical protein ASG39_21255 [Rhizobium sp. Leaf371]
MQPLKVLVVEDEMILLVDIVDLVEDNGHATLEAQNADVAMGLLERHADIDVLITDIDMPGSMDGLELARRARAIYPDIAVVVISGKWHASNDDVPPGGRFIPKPYPRSAITEVLKQLASA